MDLDNLYRQLFKAIKEGTVDAVRAAASSAFQSAVAVTDTAFRVLSADKDPGSRDDMLKDYGSAVYVSADLVNSFHSHRLIEQLETGIDKVILVDWEYFHEHPHITTGIFHEGRILGSIVVLIHDRQVNDEMKEALTACAQACAVVMHMQNQGKKRIEDTDRFTSLLFHGSASEETIAAAVQNGIVKTCPRYTVTVSALMPDSEWTRILTEQLSCLIYTDGGISYILSAEKAIAGYHQWICERGFSYGCSFPFRDLQRTPFMASQAFEAYRFASDEKQKKRNWNMSSDALYILAGSRSNRWFVHPAIQEIREYDSRSHTEYLPTLKQWLIHARDYTETAAHMHIHRNSLYYRIGKIKELFIPDLEDINVCVQLYLTMLKEEEPIDRITN